MPGTQPPAGRLEQASLWINRGLAAVAGVALATMMGFTAFDVVMRALGRPVAGSVEIIGWLAAVGLINMGSRSVPYVLQALTGQAGSKAFRQACHHVLNDLAKRNTVLQGILAPVVEVLGNVDPDAGVISSRAQVALTELRALSGG